MRISVYAQFLFLLFLATFSLDGAAQSSAGGAGTINGTVVDSSGSAIPGAAVAISNRVTNFQRTVTTDASGAFQFTSVPQNPYHLTVTSSGFGTAQQDVTVRSAVPVPVKMTMEIAAAATNITVEGGTSDAIENVPYQHNDVDRDLLSKLPPSSPGNGLSDAIANSSPGVVSDSNGMFHPLGDHGQTTLYVDGQPISDQQSKEFSTQIPVNALQSMEMITGSPSAEYGDKTSLVVNATTRSGLNQKGYGSVSTNYGSFGTTGGEITLGAGTKTFGNFLLVNGARSGRFLDTPEFHPFHDVGNNETIFDRVDWQPTSANMFHMNIYGSRNWFQVPNTYDQLSQDQRQLVTTYNFAPSYQRTISPHMLLTLNGFVRQDRVTYSPSGNLFNDTPATVSQNRHLTNYGVRGDVSYVLGGHNFKFGGQWTNTDLAENFALGITDPNFNSVCVDQQGNSVAAPSILTSANCAKAGYQANPGLSPGLIPYDLTRGGALLRFSGNATVKQFAMFAQDQWTIHNLSLSYGLRFDYYNGLTLAHGIQPRVGFSYNFTKTGTVIRASYSRTFETPYNENLILSSSTGAGGLASNVFGASASQPIQPGRRNQYNTGFQQALSKYLIVDADYFWKFTDNAFDFGTLLNTPIVFPISWRKSKIDGIAARFSTPNIKGFQAYTTFGHTRARYFGPSNGGLIFNSPLDTSVFRIDHDQAFQQTTNLRYQHKKDGPWASFTWRYDSGMVASAVDTLGEALALTAAQQSAIGFYCGGQSATLLQPITSCSGNNYGATRLNIPAPGTANDDHNPGRIAPRNLFDAGVGIENLFHTEKRRTSARFTVVNLTNNVALYNFLSTFSGTHFVTPRSYQAELTYNF